MTIKKFDYTQSTSDIFYTILYPVYAKEFMFGNNYENFAFTVSANFILNSTQWEYILEHWEQKESLLNVEPDVFIPHPIFAQILNQFGVK